MTEQEKNQEQTVGAGSSQDDENIEVVNETETVESDEEVLDPEQMIEQLQDNLTKEREKYLRALADLDNLRKRCRRDVEEARVSGRINVLEEMLPALDSIDMAIKSIEPNEHSQAVFDGMMMVQKQFFSSMERFELKPIKALGQKFDPAIHEAVSYVPSPDHESGEIMAEMRSGYMLGQRLLRAAMVVVSSGQPAASADEATSDDATGEDNTTSETASTPEEN